MKPQRFYDVAFGRQVRTVLAESFEAAVRKAERLECRTAVEVRLNYDPRKRVTGAWVTLKELERRATC